MALLIEHDHGAFGRERTRPRLRRVGGHERTRDRQKRRGGGVERAVDLEVDFQPVGRQVAAAGTHRDLVWAGETVGRPEPTVWRWHAVGLVALLLMLGLYAVAGYAAGGRGRLFAVLGTFAAVAVAAALLGRACRWQESRRPMIAWPTIALLATLFAGWVDPAATRDLPGTITITFAFIGLACGRGRSILLLPLGIAAFVIAADDPGLPTVVVTALMWVLVAEVPAWLIARLEEQSALLRRIAQTDALTQLLDRSTLAARMSEHAADAAVLLIDLDGFKRYNDRCGHEEGDKLLVAFADALRQSIRGGPGLPARR